MNKKYHFCFGALVVFGLVSSMVLAQPTFYFDFGSSGTDDDELSSPSDIALSSSGNTIYVVDTQNNRINAFDDTGDHVFEFGSFCDMTTQEGCNDNAPDAEEDGDGQFNEPSFVAVDEFGDIFVSDSQNYRVQKFDSSGDFELKFGSSDDSDQDYLAAPVGIAIQESTRNIYVASEDTDSILVFDSSGDFEFKFGSTGSDEGEFRNPIGIIIDDSEELLYVADSDNDRIQIFKLVDSSTCPQGTTEIVDGVCFVEEFGSTGTDEGEFISPMGIALDESSGVLYVSDNVNSRIQIFELVDSSTCPQGTTEIVDGVCFVEEFGSTGTDEGEFISPMGIALDESSGVLYVADPGNDRIHAFQITTTSKVPGKPTDVTASAASPTSIVLTWDAPSLDEGTPPVTGYKIEYRKGSENFSTLVANSQSTNTSFFHDGLDSEETYTYRVYAINSVGTSSVSSQSSAKPQETTVPAGLTAKAISPNQIRLSWFPPSDTFGQTITGYTVQREVTTGVYDTIAEVGSGTTTYTVGNLQTGKTYTYVVSAKYNLGASDRSNEASATPKQDSTDQSSSSQGITLPSPPRQLTATAVSGNQIKLVWNVPSSDGNSQITGYKIESKQGSGSYSVLVENTQSTDLSYTHTGLQSEEIYSYRIYAINSVGASGPSNEASTSPSDVPLQILPLGKFTIDEGKSLSFTADISAASLDDLVFSLAQNPPAGATINPTTGIFSWTPSNSQGPDSYVFDIVVRKGNEEDRQSVTINVNDVLEPKAGTSQESPGQEQTLTAPHFIDPQLGAQYYLDRYYNEPAYKDWFDRNYPEYTIEEAVELAIPGSIEKPEETKTTLPFVDPDRDPQYYIQRYQNEESYREWFDSNFPNYTIYEGVGLEEPPKGICGPGTVFEDGFCKVVRQQSQGGGCLIATATYGSELAPQVQMLREIRADLVQSSTAGITFMTGFNQMYYSFSPTIADLERQNPVFKEAVKTFITPMIASLSIMTLAEQGSESQIITLGISIIALNIGMYVMVPSVVIMKMRSLIIKQKRNSF